MNQITSENIKEYLAAGESDTLEYKQTVPPQQVLEKLISAFANANGGIILFGYDEQQKNLVGVSRDQVNRLVSGLKGLKYKDLCSVYTISVDDHLIGVLSVEKAKSDVYVNGVAYIRNGNKIFGKIGKIRSIYLRNFINEIQYHNRNPRDIKALELMNDLSTNPERILPIGTLLYRCRIISNMKDIGKEDGFYGYGKKDSFIPPVKATRDMRANYRYIPYLYCANHPYTALVEVRPRLGANVSIATIKTNKEISLLDFTLNETPKKMSEPKENLFADMSMLFSKPVTSDDDILDYIPTQYIAEFSKYLGYDGIAFRSSLTPELEDQDLNISKEADRYNIVLFNYDKCAPIKSNIINVVRNYLEYKQIDQDTEKLERYIRRSAKES
mgnify:CR=1 FL=1